MEQQVKRMEIRNLSKTFFSKKGYFTAIDNVSFDVYDGEFLVILGPGRCGKTVMLNIIAGVEDATEGQIIYNGKEWKGLNPEIGMVFQDCKAAFCPVRTVGAQIYEALSAHEKITKKEAESRTREIMEKIGLTDYKRVLRSYPFELSGGMNQRAGICAAMILKPALLLADEPTSALDVTVQKQVAEELLLMRREYHTAMILVTHNIGLVKKTADKILVLKDGRVREYGKTRDVLENPRDLYTKKLMDSVLSLKRIRSN